MKEFACLTINLVRKDMKNMKRSNLIERDTIARGPRANLEILLISLKSYSKAFKAWFNLSTTGEQTKLLK